MAAGVRKFLFINTDFEIEEEQLSVATSAGGGDSGKLANLDGTGKFDISFIPDSVITERDWKDSVRVAAETNIDISSAPATIDGLTMAAGERVLLAGQTAGDENGIYVWTATSAVMLRSTDADVDAEVTSGLSVAISEGTRADSYAMLTTNDPITLDTTSLTFTFLNVTNLIPGDGIDIGSNTVSVDLVADGGLEIISTELQVKFADTSVTADLDGTNGLHAISSENLNGNSSTEGAYIIGADPTTISQSSAITTQGILEDLSNALDAVASGVDYTTGTGGVTIGDLVYISSDNTVLPLPVTGGSSANYGIGLASTTEVAAATVNVSSNDVVLAGVLTALTPTAGDPVYWDGSALTLTAPSGGGSLVWLVGISKNPDDLHVDIQRIKRNAA